MDAEQSRAILKANADRENALRNLGNASAMSTDDPRAKEMLEEAGDAYARAANRLDLEDRRAILALTGEGPLGLVDDDPQRPRWFEDGTVVSIAGSEGTGTGTVVTDEDHRPERPGDVLVRLTSAATFRGEDLKDGELASIPADCLVRAEDPTS